MSNIVKIAANGQNVLLFHYKLLIDVLNDMAYKCCTLSSVAKNQHIDLVSFIGNAFIYVMRKASYLNVICIFADPKMNFRGHRSQAR